MSNEGYQDGPVRAMILARIERALDKEWETFSQREVAVNCGSGEITEPWQKRIMLSCESHLHNVPARSEQHFKLVLVTDMFNLEAFRKNRLARQRFVYSAVGDDLLRPIDGASVATVHMLSMVCLTLEEWFEKGGAVEQSPPCLGGMNHFR